jgi:hypothetical protein
MRPTNFPTLSRPFWTESSPLDASELSEALEQASDTKTARRMAKQHQPLRGIRGVPLHGIAELTGTAWRSWKPTVKNDEEELSSLFQTAWEDGLVAIGLLGSCVPEEPEQAFDLGRSWLDQTDDLATADALGWIVLGGASLLTAKTLDTLYRHNHVLVRRAVTMAGMAWTSAPMEGPSAAALREKLGERTIRWTDHSHDAKLTTLCHSMLRDEAPSIRKALRRVLRAWTADQPSAVVQWADDVRGGLPKMLRAEVDRARRAQKRKDRA